MRCTGRASLGRDGRRYRGWVDNRDPWHEFITSRRDKINPQQAGDTASRQRRMPGLPRMEVATLAGRTVYNYSEVERG